MLSENSCVTNTRASNEHTNVKLKDIIEIGKKRSTVNGLRQPTEDLTIVGSFDGRFLYLELTGHLVKGTSSDLHGALDDCLVGACSTVLVDPTNLQEVDVSGAIELLTIRRALLSQGKGFQIMGFPALSC